MTNEHQDGEREAYTYSPQDGDNGHCFAAQVWDADGNSVAIVDGKDANEANARAKMITEALNARARLDKAAVEPVPVDAVEWIVEAYPVHDANEAKQFLADTVDATENFSGTMYWVRDSENRAVAITGCGAKGKQNAERIASLPARRGVSEEAGKCEVLDQQAVSDALATYNESYGNGVDKGQCIRRAIRKYLDTLGLDAEGRPYALKQRLGGKSEDQ